MTDTEKREQSLRIDILHAVRAGMACETPDGMMGDLHLMLAFRTESELKEIARRFHVRGGHQSKGRPDETVVAS